MIKNKIITLLLLCILNACAKNDKNFNYRTVNKKGEAVYIDRRMPAQNKVILENSNQDTFKVKHEYLGEKYYTNNKHELSVKKNNKSYNGAKLKKENNVIVPEKKTTKPQNPPSEQEKQRTKNTQQTTTKSKQEIQYREDTEKNNENLSKGNEAIENGFVKIEDINFNESKNIDKIHDILLSNQNISSNNKKTIKAKNKKAIKYYVRAGIFAKEKQASKIANQLSSKIKMPIEPLYDEKNSKYIVKIGHFTSREDAEIILEEIVNSGYYDVIIINE